MQIKRFLSFVFYTMIMAVFCHVGGVYATCSGEYYDDNGVCMPCPEPYTYDTTSVKESITD